MLSATYSLITPEETSDEGEAEAGEEEINAAWVMEQDRETLVNLITENSLDIDPDDYADDDEGLNDLREMVCATAFPEEEAGEEAGEEAAEESEAYTQEALEDASTDDLKEIYKAWEMGAFPKFSNAASEKIARKTAIKAIPKTQDDATA